MTELLRDFWYVALPGRELKPGRLKGVQMLGEPVVVGRRADGEVFALRDICPHRGVPLRYGEIVGDCVRCCYHGWTFSTETGQCREIPSLRSDQKVHIDRIKSGYYHCREVQGQVWVYMPRDWKEPPAEADLPEVPALPGIGDAEPELGVSMMFNCDVDHAAVGLIDPPHTAYIHTAWFWRNRSGKPTYKERPFVPFGNGFQMAEHKMQNRPRLYRILGTDIRAELTFQLPALRMERAIGDRHSIATMTAITPIDEKTSMIHSYIYWTMRHFAPLRPIIRAFARTFLEQDRIIVNKQEEGLRYNPSLILLEDGDTQAKWYYRIKQEWLKAQAEGRPFKNPLEPKTLRYYS
jgi:phenylpropionate dioxygenase-like ring-hydroxylating dioxygenase large terminal subunit